MQAACEWACCEETQVPSPTEEMLMEGLSSNQCLGEWYRYNDTDESKQYNARKCWCIRTSDDDTARHMSYSRRQRSPIEIISYHELYQYQHEISKKTIESKSTVSLPNQKKNNSTVITRTCQSRCFQRRNRSQASKSSNHWTDWLQRLLLWNASRMAAAHIDAPGPKASIHHRQFGRPRWSHSHGQCSSDQPATNRPKIYHITRLNAYGRWLWLMTMMMNDEQWMIDNDGRWWWWWSMMKDEWWWSMIW